MQRPGMGIMVGLMMDWGLWGPAQGHNSAVDKIIITDRCKHMLDASKSWKWFPRKPSAFLSCGVSSTKPLFLSCGEDVAWESQFTIPLKMLECAYPDLKAHDVSVCVCACVCAYLAVEGGSHPTERAVSSQLLHLHWNQSLYPFPS